MTLECNFLHANGWEPSYFGFLMNGVLFSIGFYLYNISIIYSSMGAYNYYITVLQLTITRFSIIILIVWIIEKIFLDLEIFTTKKTLMIIGTIA